MKWIQEGDTNTAYFHALLRQRRNSNYIPRIKDSSGAWIQEENDIKHSVVQFFSLRFLADTTISPFKIFSLRFLADITISPFTVTF